MTADVGAAVASVPSKVTGALGDALFILGGAVAVGLVVSFVRNFIPGDWAPEIALVISAVLAYVFRAGIFGKLALGGMTAAALLVLQKWGSKFGMPVALAQVTGGA